MASDYKEYKEFLRKIAINCIKRNSKQIVNFPKVP